MSSANLLWGVLFSSIGFGFLVYGKKQRQPVALVCGLGLMLLPYLIFDATLLVLLSSVLVALPFVLKS